MHDWGAMIGMAWAVRFPERVARLVVLNGAAFHVPPDAHVPAALHLVRNRALGALTRAQLGLLHSHGRAHLLHAPPDASRGARRLSRALRKLGRSHRAAALSTGRAACALGPFLQPGKQPSRLAWRNFGKPRP